MPLPVGTVTFLFSDIEESTALLRRVGDEHAFASIRGIHRRLLREAVTAHEGREIDTAGDGFFIAFDSTRNAVAAAVSAQVALAAAEWPTGGDVRVRMGLHTAEPHLSEEGYVGVGVHRAARICEAARGGQILVSNATAGIIEDAELTEVEVVDLGEHQLKGLPHAQRLFQLSVLTLPSNLAPPRTVDAEVQVPGVARSLFTDLYGFRHVLMSLGDEPAGTLVIDYRRRVVTLIPHRTDRRRSHRARRRPKTNLDARAPGFAAESVTAELTGDLWKVGATFQVDTREEAEERLAALLAASGFRHRQRVPGRPRSPRRTSNRRNTSQGSTRLGAVFSRGKLRGWLRL